jgi:UPF0716 protein FxsA
VFAFLIALVAMAVLELYVMIQVGSAIGAFNAIAILILVSIFGLWLTKHAGFAVLNRMRVQVEAGRMPTAELIDGVLVLAAGLLLVFPGFVSDAFGLLLLFPPTRAVARGFSMRRIRARVQVFQIRRGPNLGPGPGPDDVIDV